MRPRTWLRIVGASATLLLIAFGPASRTGADIPDGNPLLDAASLPDVSPPPFAADPFLKSWYQTPHDEAGVTDPLSDAWISSVVKAVGGPNDFVTLGGVGDDSTGGKTFWRVPSPPPGQRTEIDCFSTPGGSNPCNFPTDVKDPVGCAAGALECFKVNVQDGWVPGDSSDSVMVVFDQNRYTDENGTDGNYAIWLYHACPPLPFTNSFCGSGRQHGTKWTAEGLSVSYLDSNGLPGCWPVNYPDALSAPWLGLNGDGYNFGHFGVPPPYQSIRYDEVVMSVGSGPPQGSPNWTDQTDAGVAPIPHMLKLVLPSAVTSDQHFFPSTGDDGDGSNPIPMGIQMRIRPGVTITREMVGGNKYALAIAMTLQTYGTVVGDSTNDLVLSGTENLVLEGSSHRWSDLGLTSDALSGIPLEDFEFLYRGYGGPSKLDYVLFGSACEDAPIR